jgi:hypothetical protein
MDATQWKRELRTAADRIVALASFRRFSERRANQLERELILAFFCVRTLMERRCLSNELLAQQITVDAHPKRTQEPTTWLNNHKIDELFDLATAETRQIDLAFLCNQVIHSTVFLPVQDGHRFSHVLVCSDYERNRSLFLIELNVTVGLLMAVSKDWHNATSCVFNPKKQDYDVRNYRGAEHPVAPYPRPARTQAEVR